MQPKSTARFNAIALLGALAASLVFVPGLGGGFIFDDRQNIAQNAALRIASLDPESLLYAMYSFQPGQGSRALPMLTFALDFWRGGMDPAVFKATNIALHAITLLAVVALFRLWLLLAGVQARRASIAAVALATAWAVHPLQVSSVLYVVQRMQTMGTLFLVLALWAYTLMRQAQIDGTRSRQHAVLAILFWGLAFASKEDSAVLPAYTLLLELTLLRFRAARPALERTLRTMYAALTAVGMVAFLAVVVPHYWHSEAYPGRNFSSYERLLTQGRVLAMYLGQILLPLPDRMPFFYDDFVVSRSLLSPATTLPSLLLHAILLALAWWQRGRRPLFALGVLLFFAGHFVTSNVLNLELAFEHRNHFPLLGAVLAIGSLGMEAWQRWQLRPATAGRAAVVLLAALALATGLRSHQWGNPTRMAEAGVRLAPDSERAWTELCTRYFDLNAGVRDSPYIDKAIAACQQGAARTQSPLLLFNVIVYKTFRGSPTRDDWPPFIRALRQAPASAEVASVEQAVIRNVTGGFPMDAAGAIEAIDVIVGRTPLTARQYVDLAIYVQDHSPEDAAGLPYLERAVRATPPGDPMVQRLYRDLEAAGREDWVAHLRTLQATRPPE